MVLGKWLRNPKMQQQVGIKLALKLGMSNLTRFALIFKRQYTFKDFIFKCIAVEKLSRLQTQSCIKCRLPLLGQRFKGSNNIPEHPLANPDHAALFILGLKICFWRNLLGNVNACCREEYYWIPGSCHAVKKQKAAWPQNHATFQSGRVQLLWKTDLMYKTTWAVVSLGCSCLHTLLIKYENLHAPNEKC